jgi:hypothetical protein
MKFPEVAAQYSEDKARQGVWTRSYWHQSDSHWTTCVIIVLSFWKLDICQLML